MRGLGRNVRCMTRMLNKTFLSMLIMLGMMLVMFGIMGGTFKQMVSEMLPFYIMMIVIYSVCLNCINGGNTCLLVAVSMGSPRKQSSVATIIAQHIILGEAACLLELCAYFLKGDEMMRVVLECPMGTCGVLLMFMGIGSLISLVCVRYEAKYGAILAVLFMMVGILAVVLLVNLIDSEMSMNIIKKFNTPISLLVGLVVDMVASFIYYRGVHNIDLKLA